MEKNILQERIAQLTKDVQESLENYQKLKVNLENSMNIYISSLGRLTEAQEIYKEFYKNEIVPTEEIKNLVNE
jgi:hypothetical protein